MRCRRPIGHWIATLVRDVGALAVFTYRRLAARDHRRANLGYDQAGSTSARSACACCGQANLRRGLSDRAWPSPSAIAGRRRVLARRGPRRGRGGRLRDQRATRTSSSRGMVSVRHHAVGGSRRRRERAHDPHPAHLRHPDPGDRSARGARARAAGLSPPARPHRADRRLRSGRAGSGHRGWKRAGRSARRSSGALRFAAPLGVFATDGDVGPPLRRSCSRAPTSIASSTQSDAGSRCRRRRARSGSPACPAGRGRRAQRRAAGADPRRARRAADHRIVISRTRPTSSPRMPFDVDLVAAPDTRHGGQVVDPVLRAARRPRSGCRGATREA